MTPRIKAHDIPALLQVAIRVPLDISSTSIGLFMLDLEIALKETLLGTDQLK